MLESMLEEVIVEGVLERMNVLTYVIVHWYVSDTRYIFLGPQSLENQGKGVNKGRGC